jgi:Na+-driven multidrug efflux pump
MEQAVLVKTLTNGSSEMLTQLSLGITTYLFNLFTLKYAGEAGIAAITIILYSEMLLTAVYIGVTYGVAPIFSYNLGAMRRDKILHTLKLSLFFLAIASAMSFSMAQLFAANLVQIFAAADGCVLLLSAWLIWDYCKVR